MSDLKRAQQRGGKHSSGMSPEGGRPSEQDESRSSGRQAAAPGTNRDYDESERSVNQGHGHPREELDRSE